MRIEEKAASSIWEESMMKNILSRISEEYDNFTYSQKTVANFVMENLNLIAFDTLEDVYKRQPMGFPAVRCC